MNPYAIEVTQHNGKQELERNGYTLVRLPEEQGNAN